MRVRLGTAVVVVILGYAAFLAWRMERLPAPPQPAPVLADLGTIKSDLFVYARAERAYFAATGRYATMQELRSDGLVSLPPDIRWPYFYSIRTAPDRFVIVALAKGPFGSRPIAITIDDAFNMRRFDAHQWPHPEPRHRRSAMRRLFS